MVALALTASVYDHSAIRQRTERQNADYAAALAIVGERFQPGDSIMYARQDWYFMLPPAVAYYLPPQRRPREVVAVTPAATAGWWTAIECVQPARCLGDAPRLWVVRLTDDGTDPLAGVEEPMATVLRQRYVVTNIWQSQAITVVLLDRGDRRQLHR